MQERACPSQHASQSYLTSILQRLSSVVRTMHASTGHIHGKRCTLPTLLRDAADVTWLKSSGQEGRNERMLLDEATITMKYVWYIRKRHAEGFERNLSSLSTLQEARQHALVVERP